MAALCTLCAEIHCAVSHPRFHKGQAQNSARALRRKPPPKPLLHRFHLHIVLHYQRKSPAGALLEPVHAVVAGIDLGTFESHVRSLFRKHNAGWSTARPEEQKIDNRCQSIKIGHVSNRGAQNVLLWEF